MHPLLFQFGRLAIPTSGVLTAVAIVAALFTARATAGRLGLDRERVWDLGIAGLLAALIAPRLALIVLNWSDFRAHPLWMLGVVGLRSRTALAGGLALALAVAFAYARLARLPLRRTLDAFAPALALGCAVASVGAFAAGSSFGTPTRLPWGVAYTSRLASLWYRTPLGVPLHPVQVYEALLQGCLLFLLLWMVSARQRHGDILGTWLFLSGLSGFFLCFLRGDLTSTASFIPLQQIAAFCMVLAGGLLWL